LRLLDTILSDPVLADLFEKHLVSEFAVESLYFLRDSTAWFDTYHDVVPSAATARAQKIFRLYIQPEGILAVNISHKVVQRISQKLKSAVVEQNIFKAAQQEVTNLLEHGPMLRFFRQPDVRLAAEQESPVQRRHSLQRPSQIGEHGSFVEEKEDVMMNDERFAVVMVWRFGGFENRRRRMYPFTEDLGVIRCSFVLLGNLLLWYIEDAVNKSGEKGRAFSCVRECTALRFPNLYSDHRHLSLQVNY